MRPGHARRGTRNKRSRWRTSSASMLIMAGRSTTPGLRSAAHALREGDKDAAVRYMLEAANGPASSRLDERFFFGLDTRLVNYLLKEGERESVAQFLEKSAGLRGVDRDRLLKDAAAIRAGRMPMSYQYMVTRSE